MNPETTQQLITSAIALAQTLAEENEALRQLDVSRALALLDRKRLETDAFNQAQSATEVAATDTPFTPDQLALAQSVAARLEGAAAENKRLLERAIAVQGQVVGVLLRAVPAAQPPARYSAVGGRVDRPQSFALYSRI
jgi:hypothetical protein